MSGYFMQPALTSQVLADDGWLDTGDVGYVVDGEVVVTGRHKDMIIVNGRNIWPQDIERIVERQPELRSQDASAFGVAGPDGAEIAAVVVQSNTLEPGTRDELVQRIRGEILQELGITCLIELVPRHTLPRTSSGKLSRSATRSGYLERRAQEQHAQEQQEQAPVALAS
jgi:fatty-acyl-CoA synthase